MIKVLFETELTDIKKTDIEGVGTLRYEDDGRIFRWVKNRNATALVADQPVCYDAGNVGSAALYKSVNMPVTADLMLAAGVTKAAFGISGAKCFGWIQVQGYFKEARVLAVSDTAVAIGDELNTQNGSDQLHRTTAVGTAPIRQHTFTAFEILSGDTGADLDKDVYINCL